MMGPINAGYELGMQFPIMTGISIGVLFVLGILWIHSRLTQGSMMAPATPVVPGGRDIDPSALTTQQLQREITMLRELLEARLEGQSAAIEQLKETVSAIPQLRPVPQFSLVELQTISNALRIAGEDGSIFRGAEKIKIMTELDVIHDKISFLIALAKK